MNLFVVLLCNASQSTEAFGRKNSLISIAIVQISSWILIIIAQSSFLFYISRFCAGLAGGGLYIVVPLYVSEISEDRIRGRLGSTFIFSVGIGVLLSYTCGTFMAFDIVPYIYIPISVLFLIGISFTPESPFFLIKQNKDNVSIFFCDSFNVIIYHSQLSPTTILLLLLTFSLSHFY